MSHNPASTRLVPAERLSAITSLIAEGAVFDGNFHTTRDQGIKVDGQLKGNITFETGGTLHVGAAAVTINTIDNSTKTWIAGTRGGDGVDSAANIALLSTDSSRIFGLAGALGASTDKAGVGVSFAWNDVDNLVDARLKDSANAESTAGDVSVRADSTWQAPTSKASQQQAGSPARLEWPVPARSCKPTTPSRPASTPARRRLPMATSMSAPRTMLTSSAWLAMSPAAAKWASAHRPRC